MTEPLCSAILHVDEQLRAVLDQLPGETYSIQDEYSCDLELPNHEGLHHAVAQGAENPMSGTEIWIRWRNDSQAEVVELPDCESERGDEVCVLFDHHPGPHTSGANTWT